MPLCSCSLKYSQSPLQFIYSLCSGPYGYRKVILYSTGLTRIDWPRTRCVNQDEAGVEQGSEWPACKCKLCTEGGGNGAWVRDAQSPSRQAQHKAKFAVPSQACLMIVVMEETLNLTRTPRPISHSVPFRSNNLICEYFLNRLSNPCRKIGVNYFRYALSQ